MLSIVLYSGSAMVVGKASLLLGSSRAPANGLSMQVAGTMPVSVDTTATKQVDVVIVGAGAAGVGTALMLTKTFGLDPSSVLLVERGEEVGATFRRWPAEMRFISPSFNMQGWTNSFDLNSVAFGTSPAYSLHEQHPSGAQYADYLSALVSSAKLNVRTSTEVTSITPPEEEGGLFSVSVRSRDTAGVDKLAPKYVVWAAGEFQYPSETQFTGAIEGAEHCLHNSRVKSWAELEGDDFVVIGGYESGSDATFNLAKAGKKCTMLASSASWDVSNPDPSTELAPYTAARLREVTAEGFAPRPNLLAPLRVHKVEKAEEGGFNVFAEWKEPKAAGSPGPLRTPLEANAMAPAGKKLVVRTPQPPILATGFQGSVSAAASHLFNLADEKDEAESGCLCRAPLITDHDESTKVPGVFLVGPTVSHGCLSFCFIYKFRQRFAIVADAICRGLGRDTTQSVQDCRMMDMYLDDIKYREALMKHMSNLNTKEDCVDDACGKACSC